MGPAASYRSLATWRDCGIQPSRKHWSLVMADKPRTGAEKALTDWIATGMPAKLICQQEDCHDVDLAAEGFKAGYAAALASSGALGETNYEHKYNRIMGLLRNTKMPHGLCEPRERKACTHCNAVEELEQVIAKYKGARVSIAALRQSVPQK